MPEVLTIEMQDSWQGMVSYVMFLFTPTNFKAHTTISYYEKRVS